MFDRDFLNRNFRHTQISVRRPRQTRAWLLACSLTFLSASHALSEVSCKPLLSFRNVREIRPSEMPTHPWIWKASIATDRRYCATHSGMFEIDFIRIKENSPDVQFTEKFRWSPGQFEVSIELWPDESILQYRLGFIAPCVCRELSSDE